MTTHRREAMGPGIIKEGYDSRGSSLSSSLRTTAHDSLSLVRCNLCARRATCRRREVPVEKLQRVYPAIGSTITSPIGSSPVVMRATTANSTMSMATTSLRPVTVT